MEQQTVITQSTPLLEGTCSYGVVEHPFPMNCFLKDWSLGPEFYHAVKIGIVQYVCVVINFSGLWPMMFFYASNEKKYSAADDTENDLCSISNDP